MGLDVPEILIVLGVLSGVAWAVYNRLRHRSPKCEAQKADHRPDFSG
jgi:hypothetical protein